MTQSLLQFDRVHRAFDGIQVLRGADLTVRTGEHVLVFGPSGSGKTTVLNLAARLLEPDSGTVAYAGRDLAQSGDPRTYRLAHIGFVFQEFHLLESLTVYQNIEMVQLARGAPDPLDIALLLGPLDLLDRRDAPVRVLSRGERQRVALARAFANRPSLVLADEPTASLDPSKAHATMDHLFDLLGRTGATALVVSHDEALAKRAEFTQVLRLEGGALAPAVTDRRPGPGERGPQSSPEATES